ncbi:MAG: ABC transporter permease [Bacteroidales bacterium]|nr:ABC transporter permease [Bacteroidales bacterium]
MIKLFFKTLFRNQKREKINSAVIYINLIVGYIFFISIMIIHDGEMTYDQYQEHYDNIYRVQFCRNDVDDNKYVTCVPYYLRDEYLNNVSEIENSAMIISTGGIHFSLSDNKLLDAKNGYYAENSIFNILTFKILEGDTANAISEPYTIAISKKIADKIFPNQSAIGQQILVDKTIPLKVNVVYEDLPSRSDIRPEFMISLSTKVAQDPNALKRGDWNYFYYVLLTPNADPEKINKQIENIIPYERLYTHVSPYLHHISQHHIAPNNQEDLLIAFRLLLLAGLLIIFLAYANYINLMLANSNLRVKEIAVKKTFGLSKKELALQFIFESLFITYSTVIIALLFITLILPQLGSIIPMTFGVTIEYELWTNISILLKIFGISTLIGILASIYPSFVMASQNPIKNLNTNKKGKTFFDAKTILLTIQFIISLIVINIGFISNRSVDYIFNKDLGFNRNDILYSEIVKGSNIDIHAITEKLKENNNILNVSISRNTPFLNYCGARALNWSGHTGEDFIDTHFNNISSSFVETLGLRIIAGRNFYSDDVSDSLKCIINQKAVEEMKLENPLDAYIDIWGNRYQIIGVVEDYNVYSIYNPKQPNIMVFNNNKPNSETSNIITIRHTPNHSKDVNEYAERVLNEMYPNVSFTFYPFTSYFDEDLATILFKALNKAFKTLTVLGLILLASGLFAIMSYNIKRKTKEIGLRQVLGASKFNLFNIISKKVFILMIISELITIVFVKYYCSIINGEIPSETYIQDWIISFTIVALISIITIVFHLFKILQTNPINSLKTE